MGMELTPPGQISGVIEFTFQGIPWDTLRLLFGEAAIDNILGEQRALEVWEGEGGACSR